MLKAPVMISSHGRYNEIGRSCYYFADTKEGALTEVYKHCGSKKPSVQIAKLKKCKEARLIDLSQNVSKNNRFIDHLRFRVDNTPGKNREGVSASEFCGRMLQESGDRWYQVSRRWIQLLCDMEG